MPRLDLDSRRRVLALHQLGYSFSSITERLQEDIIITSRSLQQLEKKFRDKGIFKDLPRKKQSKKLSQAMVEFLNDKLEEDDELTSTN